MFTKNELKCIHSRVINHYIISHWSFCKVHCSATMFVNCHLPKKAGKRLVTLSGFFSPVCYLWAVVLLSPRRCVDRVMQSLSFLQVSSENFVSLSILAYAL